MPDSRDDLRQEDLLATYERDLQSNPAAQRPPDLDPALAAVAESLARHLGGPMPDPTRAPDPAFRAALRARLAAQARASHRSPNGAAHLDATASADSRAPWVPRPRRGRQGTRPLRDGQVTPHKSALPPVPPLAPPGRAVAGPWRGGWTTMSGLFGRAGTALLLVAIVAVTLLLLRPSPSGPGGHGSTPGLPTPTTPSGTPAPAMIPPSRTATPSAPGTPTQPPAAPRWQATDALSAPRADHTATRLPDGRILVAGGHTAGGEGIAASAELYDPQTGRWQATGAMGVPRFGHRAALLADGRVLVVGGLNYRQFNNTTTAEGAELYDPASGSWRPTAPLPLAFTPSALVVLADGRALALSPSDANADRRTTALSYDPIADSWARAGNLNVPNVVAAAALRDGSALVLGELDETTEVSTPAARYDPVAGSWVAVASLPSARGRATLSALPDGRVLAVGGITFRRGADGVTMSTIHSSTAIFDLATNTWTEEAGLTTPRSGHTATTLSDSRILIVGGNANTGQSPATAELYDPQSRTWTALGETGMAAQRGFAVAPLADGRALIIGGDAGFIRSEYRADVQVLTPPVAPRVTTREGTIAATPAGTPGAGIGRWENPNAGLPFFGGRGYRVREQLLLDGSAPRVGAQVGTTALSLQSGGVFPAGVAIYAVAGQSPEEWLAIRDGARTILYRQDDSTTALLAGLQVVVATAVGDSRTVCPAYGCANATSGSRPGTIATAYRVVIERTLQGSVAAGTTIDVWQMGEPGAALPNERIVVLPPGQRVILFLQPAQRQSIGDFAAGDYYWTGPGWVYGFIDDQVVPLGGSGGVQSPRDRFEVAIRELFAAVTPRAPTDPVPTPRPVPTPTGIAPQPTAPLPGGTGLPTPSARP